MVRFFDLFFSLVGVILLLPLFLIISLWIMATSRGGIFFRQQRVGKNGKDFYLFKFRTMKPDSEQGGKLTIGSRDPRITAAGLFLRKFKLDELPQLFNVITGEMSLVGPRPEVRKYVELYSAEQQTVLQVKPGITDYASIAYMDENTLLGRSADPERTYIETIIPEKIRLNMKYIENQGLSAYFKILILTLLHIFKKGM
ncbi:MAG TPA: sugar transferase [Bacteroidales bacterium]|nr:sugar transferase [Bacteroidales bacterium]HPS51548.1 sugar transferase [Bacteroidales bacterium]